MPRDFSLLCLPFTRYVFSSLVFWTGLNHFSFFFLFRSARLSQADREMPISRQPQKPPRFCPPYSAPAVFPNQHKATRNESKESAKAFPWRPGAAPSPASAVTDKVRSLPSARVYAQLFHLIRLAPRVRSGQATFSSRRRQSTSMLSGHYAPSPALPAPIAGGSGRRDPPLRGLIKRAITDRPYVAASPGGPARHGPRKRRDG